MNTSDWKNMKLRLLALGLLSSLALAGCRTASIKGDYNFADHPGKGLVVFSTRMVGYDACPYGPMKGLLGFRTPAPNSLTLEMQAPRPERKVTNPADGDDVILPADPPTRFAVQEVPAGQYVLNSLIVTMTGYPASPQAVSLPLAWFDLKEGEVVYLGELGLKVSGRQCVFGSAAFRVRDEWERDQPQFKAAIHNISPDAVKKRLLKTK
ncbi:hypothetical protein [Pyxidicoccus caerfyrddinensis]|uniref:hypothetical protein n=1 Tax=Pyxidicoccus caerfyrddinensis TaxID=2709663 RepID=UPI0013DB0C56|nr:hypothetical protein [Pyxidicoccus caerfyrddinensis]